MDNEGFIRTWSMPTGKNIYYEDQHVEEFGDWFDEFQIYQAEKDDIAYSSDTYNLENYSL